MDVRTTSDVAAELGVTPQAINRVCVAHGIGTMPSTRMRLLTAEDVEKLRGLVHAKPGNPTFGRTAKAKAAAKKATPRKKADPK